MVQNVNNAGNQQYQKCHYCSKNLDFTIWSLCLESAYVVFVKYSSKVNISCIKMALGNHHA